MNRIRCVLIHIIALATVSYPLLAEDKQGARQHFEAGLTHLKKGDFQAAAEELEMSVSMLPTKAGLYNLACCYQGLNRPVKALDVFRRTLDEFSEKLDDDTRQDIENQIFALKSIIVKLGVECNRDGATVGVDGDKIGNTPLVEHIMLDPGEHTVEVSLEHHDTIAQKLNLAAGDVTSLHFKLEESKASLRIGSNEDGAEIRLDEKRVGTTPLTEPLGLNGGNYLITVWKNGFEISQRSVELTPGEETTVTMDLVQIPQVPSDKPEPKLPPVEPQSKRRFSSVFWTGVAGTLVFAGLSAGMWARAVSRRNEYESLAGAYNAKVLNDAWDFSSPADAAEEASLRVRVDSLADDVHVYNRIAVGMTITTGAFVALALGGVFLRRVEKTESPIALSPTQGGMRLRF